MYVTVSHFHLSVIFPGKTRAYPRGLHYKALQIRNLLQIDIFHSKLVSILLPITNHTSLDKNINLDKHTSLLRNPLITIPKCFIVLAPEFWAPHRTTSLALKYETRVRVIDSDKHSSLLRHGISYGRKMF